MTTVAQRVIQLEKVQANLATKNDLKTAMNTLEFKLLKPKTDLERRSTKAMTDLGARLKAQSRAQADRVIARAIHAAEIATGEIKDMQEDVKAIKNHLIV